MKASFMSSFEERLAPLLQGGIRYRLFLLVILMILPFASLLGITYYRDYETRRAHVMQAELEVSRGLAVTFHAYLNGIRKQSLALGDAITIFTPGDPRIDDLLRTAVASSPSVRNMSWVGPDGVVRQSTDPKLVGANLIQRPYFRKVLAGEEFAVGDLTQAGAVTHRATVATATAVRHGGLDGVMVSSIEPTRLHEVVLTQKRPEGGALALFDTRGVLVYHSSITKPSWQQRLMWLQSDVVLSKVLRMQREQAGMQTLALATSEKWVSARVPIPGVGWVAGAGRPERIAFEELRRSMMQNVVLGGAVFGLAFLLAYLLGRSITEPLLRLKNDAQLVGSGKMVLRQDPLAPREVRTLRDVLVNTTNALLQVAAELQRARDELEARVQERTAELAAAFVDLQRETEQRIAAVEELRRKEQLLIQQSRLAAMGEIMVHIAHQWRQPLNTIGLLVQDLALSHQMNTLSQEEMEGQTKKVMAVLDHLSRTIDDFRNLFSPDKAKAVFSTKDVVQRALALLGPELKEVRVEVETPDDERDCEVEGFRNEYLQVILNVLSNARDVLRGNGVAHPCIAIRIFREDGRSVVTVRDNGGGINPAIIGRIFDPYFTTKGPDKGTGIGLFMSKTIIEKNMGGILTASNTGDGAEFRIEL